MYKLVITKPAEQDLREAVQYISCELQNPLAAVALLNDVEVAINTLLELPRRNPLVRDESLSTSGFRFFAVKNYLVFYTVREATSSVVIQRILYGKRNWESLL